MKSSLMQGCSFAAGLLVCGTSFAQMGPMRMPMVPQAIETHLEQKRTLEQRAEIEAKAATAPATVPPEQKGRAAKKAKKAQSPSRA